MGLVRETLGFISHNWRLDLFGNHARPGFERVDLATLDDEALTLQFRWPVDAAF